MAFLGWFWAEHRPPITEQREADLASALLADSPRLRWAASYRSGIFQCAADDPDRILQAMRQYVSDDPSAGDPDWLVRGAADAPLLRDIVDACIQRDRAAALLALDRATGAYSTDGGDLLRTAVRQWIDSPAWLSQ